MERLLAIIILIVTASCESENSKINRENAVNNIVNSITHHDTYILSDMRSYVETNHISDPCANQLMVKLVELYDYIDSVQNFIINKSGGFDANGRLINRNDHTSFKKILEDLNFKVELNSMVASIGNIDTHYSELVSESIQQDVKPFKFNSYEVTTLTNVYIDFVMVKSNIIKTEVKYFEMLKSNFDCNNDLQI